MSSAATSDHPAAAPTQTTGPVLPLLDLAPGTTAVLRQVRDHRSHAVLRSLGLTDGARLRICRLGDPCIIQVRSTRIGLSRVVAQSIYVAVAERAVP
jgi:Fe2+ transport system protein FeoA